MGLHVDSSVATLRLANRPVLPKGLCAINGGLVDAGGNVDVVVGAVGVNSALVLASTARIVCAEVLNDIVLYKRVASPAIDSKVTVARGVEGATVVNGSIIRIQR